MANEQRDQPVPDHHQPEQGNQQKAAQVSRSDVPVAGAHPVDAPPVPTASDEVGAAGGTDAAAGARPCVRADA